MSPRRVLRELFNGRAAVVEYDSGTIALAARVQLTQREQQIGLAIASAVERQLTSSERAELRDCS